jgi:hypothetical protein
MPGTSCPEWITPIAAITLITRTTAATGHSAAICFWNSCGVLALMAVSVGPG